MTYLSEPARAEALAGKDELIQHRTYELGETVTRRENMIKVLDMACRTRMTGADIEQLADELLRIADDRTLLGLKGFADFIGRNRTTIKSWQQRGNVQVPAPTYQTENGPLWDEEVARQFCRDNPDVLRGDARGYHL